MAIREWGITPAGDGCAWCEDENSEFAPFDEDDASQTLCRGHFAEFAGESLVSLDHREAGERADMANLGYFD